MRQRLPHLPRRKYKFFLDLPKPKLNQRVHIWKVYKRSFINCQIKKDILSLKDNVCNKAETTSSSKKKIKILPRPPQTKTQSDGLDLESLQKVVQNFSNQVIDLR